MIMIYMYSIISVFSEAAEENHIFQSGLSFFWPIFEPGNSRIRRRGANYCMVIFGLKISLVN